MRINLQSQHAQQFLNSQELTLRNQFKPLTRQERIQSNINMLMKEMMTAPCKMAKMCIQNDIDFLNQDYHKVLQFMIDHPCSQNCSEHLSLKIWTNYKLGNYEEAYKDAQSITFHAQFQYRVYLILGKIQSKKLVESNIHDAIINFKKAYQIAIQLGYERKALKALQYFYRALKVQWYQNHDAEFTEPFEIPSQFCCPISFEPMLFPSVTQAGYSYEQKHLNEHIYKNGFIDPISREKINPIMYKNTALQIVIRNYLEENPWAFEFQITDKEKYCKIAS